MTAIINGKVLNGIGTIIEKGTVLVENGKITAVGADVAVPAGAQVIDAEGKWITPGFIDCHTHVGMAEEPKTRGDGADVNEGVAADTSHVRAIDAFDPCSMAIEWVLKGGFSTICVLPGSANVIGGEGFVLKTAPKTTVDQMEIPGTRVMKFALGENPRWNHKNTKARTRMGVAATFREALYNAKVYSDALLAAETSDEKPPKPDFKLNALVPVVRGQMMCRIHCHRSDDIATAVRVAEEFGLKYALEHATEAFKMTDMLKEKNITCVIGPLVSGPYKREVWARSIATPGVLAEAGVPFCLTEDSGSLTKLLPMHVGMCIRQGLSHADALKGVTISPAKLLGIDDRTGSLEVGKDADIAIWDGDPFCNYTSCTHTIVSGEIFEHDTSGMQMI